MKPMVIFTHGGGRFGNQALNFAHLIAWVEEMAGAVNVMSIPLWNYYRLFRGTIGNGWCIYRPKTPPPHFLHTPLTFPLRKGRVQMWWATFWQSRTYQLSYDGRNLGDPTLDKQLVTQPISLISGWGPRNWSLLRKHAATVRDYLQPSAQFRALTTRFIAPLRSRHDVLFGVFIRQGDYATWHDGRFCFQAERVAKWMEVVRQWYPNAGFVLTSDARQELAAFGDLPVYMATGSINIGGHYMESVAQLAQCDFIMTPPSTFSAWAAFMGDRPIIPLRSHDQTLSQDDIFQDALFDAQRDPVFSLAVM